jgi:hypothetical protein
MIVLLCWVSSLGIIGERDKGMREGERERMNEWETSEQKGSKEGRERDRREVRVREGETGRERGRGRRRETGVKREIKRRGGGER